MKSFTAQGAGAQSILDKQIAQLSREISRGVGLSRRRRWTKPTTLMAQAADRSRWKPTNIYLSRARKAQEKYYFEDARKDIEKAIELDPEFAMAYLRLFAALFQYGEHRGRSARR